MCGRLFTFNVYVEEQENPPKKKLYLSWEASEPIRHGRYEALAGTFVVNKALNKGLLGRELILVFLLMYFIKISIFC